MFNDVGDAVRPRDVPVCTMHDDLCVRGSMVQGVTPGWHCLEDCPQEELRGVKIALFHGCGATVRVVRIRVCSFADRMPGHLLCRTAMPAVFKIEWQLGKH